MVKNENDVKILQSIITEQNAKGADMPVNLDDKAYVWSEEGRLTGLYLSSCNLSGSLSLAGLDALEKLGCYNNQLTNLDISKNPLLKSLSCSGNPLEELDVSRNPDLERIGCISCQIKDLDLSNNPLLERLDCENNQLASLNVRSNPKLEFLSCSDNCLDALDVSGNPVLSGLHCDNNRLKELDVSHNPNLDNLLCDQNELETLDISRNPMLKDIFSCDQNVKVQRAPEEAQEAAPAKNEDDVRILLTIIEEQNVLSEMPEDLNDKCYQWDENGRLTGIYLNSCRLSGNLDLSGLDALKKLDCGNNALESVNVSTCLELEELYCGHNQLKSLDIGNNKSLKKLECGANQLANLNVRANPDLVQLNCHGNLLESLDVSRNAALEELICNNNRIAELEIGKTPLLKRLICQDNRISELDASANALSKLRADETVSLQLPQEQETVQEDAPLMENPDVLTSADFLEKNGEQEVAEAFRGACEDIDRMYDAVINIRPEDMEQVLEAMKQLQDDGRMPKNITLNVIRTAERENERYSQMFEAACDAKDYAKAQSREMAEAAGCNDLDGVKQGAYNVIERAGSVGRRIGTLLKAGLYEIEKAGAKIARAAGEWREYTKADKKEDLDARTMNATDKRDKWQNRSQGMRNLTADIKTIFTGKAADAASMKGWGVVADAYNRRVAQLSNASADAQAAMERAQSFQQKMARFIQDREDKIDDLMQR